MESIVVVTVAGSGERAWRDGVGSYAAFGEPTGLCYSPIDNSLLIADTYSLRIRRMFPAMEKRDARLKQSLTSELFHTGSIPVLSLVAIIIEFAVGNSASPAPRVLCCDRFNLKHSHFGCRFFVCRCADAVITVCGSRDDAGFSQGKCLTEAAFLGPTSVCIDPIHPTCFFIGDWTSIRYVNTVTDAVSLLAGAEKCGFADGIGSAASFNVLLGLICTSRGDRLYAADSQNNRIRSVDIKTGTVTTVASCTDPHKLVFDRRCDGTVPADSALYVTTADGICRVDFRVFIVDYGTGPGLGEVLESQYPCFPYPWGEDSDDHMAYGLAITPSGKLIVTCRFTHSIHLFDRTSRQYTLLAGGREDDDAGWADGAATSGAKFDTPTDVVVIDSEQCVFITDKGNHRIRRMNLPPSLFA